MSAPKSELPDAMSPRSLASLEVLKKQDVVLKDMISEHSSDGLMIDDLSGLFNLNVSVIL